MSYHKGPPHCDTCVCADVERVQVDESAPFYPLVLLCDREWHRILADDRRARARARALEEVAP